MCELRSVGPADYGVGNIVGQGQGGGFATIYNLKRRQTCGRVTCSIVVPLSPIYKSATLTAVKLVGSIPNCEAFESRPTTTNITVLF
ncbi:hypothetical protein MTR_5g089915 [Medicago truncatula]|uniref:Uncharacterized protein n=1 Tax=Medicago truncatula TaxID=3880 RepID=A0A072UFE3_MEDTR|nr:hypothetical protein MTR_5g089915 [Medicago truncatula]